MFEFDLTPHPELISPDAWIAPSADVVGRVRVGAGSSVWYGAVIRGDLEPIEIGEGTNIQDLSILHTNAGVPCRLGNGVTVGHGAIVHGVLVEDDVLIGMRAVVLNGARLGTGCFIAAGSLVVEDMEIPPGWLVWGTPAQLVRPVDDALRARIREAAEHYRGITRNLVAGVPIQREDAPPRRSPKKAPTAKPSSKAPVPRSVSPKKRVPKKKSPPKKAAPSSTPKAATAPKVARRKKR